jgi:hypothetical protein
LPGGERILKQRWVAGNIATDVTSGPATSIAFTSLSVEQEVARSYDRQTKAAIAKVRAGDFSADQRAELERRSLFLGDGPRRRGRPGRA